MKRIIFSFVLLVSFGFVKAEEIPIQGCNQPLDVIKFSEDQQSAIVLCRDGRIFVSSNQGISWSNGTSIGSSKKINDVEIITNKLIFAVGNQGLVSKTTDGGKTWDSIQNLPSVNFTKVKYINQYLFILGEMGTVLRSRDLESFEDFSVGVSGTFRDIVFKKSSGLGFLVSDQEPGLWVSLYGGSNWTSVDLPQNATGTSIALDGTMLYVIGKGDMGYQYPSPIIVKINSGDLSDWAVIPLTESYEPTGVAIKNGKGAAIMNKSTGLVWKTTLSGMSWDKLPMTKMLYSVALRGNDVYISSDSGIIIRLDVMVGVSSVILETPSDYTLSQNYPNPFNPSTKINFSIPKTGNVKLTVFDIQGKEVTMLINQSLSVGNYEVDFDATNLLSGVYFYTLQTDIYTATKKMTLVK